MFEVPCDIKMIETPQYMYQCSRSSALGLSFDSLLPEKKEHLFSTYYSRHSCSNPGRYTLSVLVRTEKEQDSNRATSSSLCPYKACAFLTLARFLFFHLLAASKQQTGFVPKVTGVHLFIGATTLMGVQSAIVFRGLSQNFK